MRDTGRDSLETTSRAGESGDDIRIETIAEERDELVADTIAGIAGIGIALVSTEFEGAGGEVAEDMGSIKGEEGADMGAMLRQHASHARRPGTADKIHEQRFGLIAHMVSESESIESMLFFQLFEESSAKFPQGVFIVRSASRIALNKAGDLIALGESADESLVSG